MKWNCPHCGVILAIGDDKINGGWSFSRCYKCSGHALVRRAEISVIKVDRAPPGERVLLPEGSESPQLGMSQVATQQYARVTAAQTPVHVQSSVQSVAPASNAQSSAAQMMAQQILAQQTPGIGIPMTDVHGISARRSDRTNNRTLPIAMGMAATLAIASGGYLLIQGRALWNKATQSVAQAPAPQVVSVTTQQAAPMSEPVQPLAAMTTTANSAPSLTVKPKSNATQLHSGPGLAFPVVGTANPDAQFRVLEWKERWFRLADSKSDQTVGWVRNDQMDSVPAVER